ncbi:MAG: RNA-binding protein [Gammaproteobacteria bacterium]|jgi:ribosome-associated heat shock protein Hsp15|uniref:Heat shock protein 15 n=1 Tax=Marinomonas polaris DSM 16579 TaxID=1122206 RepID=A0A1M5ASL2_9GAMM|nr:MULTISPECIES: S4 domain-containing protein [Marinomonas]MBU1295147.1 RNA-binding protein [Gammaproteobacteria bacterium]MBU1468383.1 RNA-binding protein [Gammaproteobacteria bacterium]MBU2238963.1 RNA-binding protein [Gammaproteobacteria bacterium]MBU2319060.1 RNA-binding protein [Gammaproteobacteria bacterium]MBU2412463.1 RNA-binding protein [Gammaproteobacteria bacterium]|tara:strand:+ start:21002 stop:21418 length:417 start_codon:yes stop_codon:yes gene_type:complete
MSKPEKQSAPQAVRLDKWLWAARFFKTRSLCKDAIDGGKVSYNGSKGKASRNVEIGALIGIRVGWDEKVVEIKDISGQRRGAPEAQLLYEETPQSIEKREKRALENKSFGGRIMSDHKPNKKERRDIKQLKKDIFSDM